MCKTEASATRQAKQHSLLGNGVSKPLQTNRIVAGIPDDPILFLLAPLITVMLKWYSFHSFLIITFSYSERNLFCMFEGIISPDPFQVKKKDIYWGNVWGQKKNFLNIPSRVYETAETNQFH